MINDCIPGNSINPDSESFIFNRVRFLKEAYEDCLIDVFRVVPIFTKLQNRLKEALEKLCFFS
jgi:hypothetical protein